MKRGDDKTFEWNINLNALYKNLNQILDGFAIGPAYMGEPVSGFPVLFVKGGNSDYISPDDEDLIKRIYPYADFVTIPAAGHWLHTEQPDLLVKAIYNFLGMD